MTDQRPRSESELVEFVRSLDVRAPDSVHRQVESLIAARAARARRTRTAPSGGRSVGRLLGAGTGLAVAGVAAAIVIVIALSSSGGGAQGISIRQASALTLSQPIAPAPAESAVNGAQLAAAVDGLAFPYWEGRLGWHSTGMRTDHVAGRTVTTVFYSDARGRQIGYAIVAGTPAPRVGGGVIVRREGTPYRLLSENGAVVVSWLREGHLCVVSGRDLNSATLLSLVSWRERGSLSS
jgi:hypothetical protein